MQPRGAGIAQDAFQIVQHQQHRLAHDPPTLILHPFPARAFQQFPQAIRQFIWMLANPIPIGIDDFPHLPATDGALKRLQNRRRVVTLEHHHRFVMM